MLRKKFVSLLFIMVFAIPLMPVMQVGSFLYQNQFSEEIASHGLFLVTKGEAAEQEYPNAGLVHFSQLLPDLHNISSDEMLSSRQADDVTTPPPNSRM